MMKSFAIGAAVAILLTAGSASAQKLDANGRCHDAKGQFAKAEVCSGASAKSSKAAKATKTTPSAMSSSSPASATAPAATPAPAGKAKAQRCKNDKGKFAKCGTPGAHPA
jgi:hypothetical protein